MGYTQADYYAGKGFAASKDAWDYGRKLMRRGQEEIESDEARIASLQRGIGLEQGTGPTDPYAQRWSLGVAPGRRYFRDKYGKENMGQYRTRDAREAAWQEEWSPAITEANSLMEQAAAAAEAGDNAEADRLRAQAQGLMAEMPTPDRGGRGGIDTTGAIDEDLASPGGQIMSELVRQGQEFLDPESETSQRFMTSLTEAPLAEIEGGRQIAQRAIAMGSREATAASRQFAMARGGVRAPGAEGAIRAAQEAGFSAARADVEIQAATERAKVIGQAKLQYENFSRAFAAGSVQGAEAWIRERAGLSYNDRMIDLELTKAGMQMASQYGASMASLATGMAATGSEERQYAMGIEAQEKANSQKMIATGVMMAVAAVGAIATGGGALAVVGAAASAASQVGAKAQGY